MKEEIGASLAGCVFLGHNVTQLRVELVFPSHTRSFKTFNSQQRNRRNYFYTLISNTIQASSVNLT